jgi:hypothetical protein
LLALFAAAWAATAGIGAAQSVNDARSQSPADRLIASEGSVHGANWSAASASSIGSQQFVGDDNLARGLEDAPARNEISFGNAIGAGKHRHAAWWMTPLIWTLASFGGLLVLSAAAVLIWRLATRSQVDREPPPMLFDLPRF